MVGMAIPLLWFAVIYIVYSIISLFLFLLTTGLDVALFAEVFIFSWIFPLYWVILLGTRFYRTEKLLELYFWKLVIAIFVLQIFTTLFNFYVCGNGSFNFIQAFIYRINVGRWPQQSSNPEQLFEIVGTEAWVPYEIVFLARILYYILNLILILVP
jgi:hypothetical protein